MLVICMDEQIRRKFVDLKVTGQRFAISPEEKREKDLSLISYLNSIIENEIVTEFQDIGFCYWNISDNYALLKDGHSLFDNHRKFCEHIKNQDDEYLYWLVCDATQRLTLEKDGYSSFWWDLYRKAAETTKALLANTPALDIINNEIIPALNVVGKGYEEKHIYLPQLLMSAEAAKAAFEVIKASSLTEEKSEASTPIVIATVRGDIHDIGKNIVKLLFENYGFKVVDLGKDVPAEVILEKVLELNAKVVGLSALMTTTVCEMEKPLHL